MVATKEAQKTADPEEIIFQHVVPVKLPGAVAELQLKDANGGQDPDQQKRQVRSEPELLIEDLNGGEDESQQHSKRQVSWEPDESEEKGTRSSNAETAHASQQSLPLRISQSNLRLQSTNKVKRGISLVQSRKWVRRRVRWKRLLRALCMKLHKVANKAYLFKLALWTFLCEVANKFKSRSSGLSLTKRQAASTLKPHSSQQSVPRGRHSNLHLRSSHQSRGRVSRVSSKRAEPPGSPTMEVSGPLSTACRIDLAWLLVGAFATPLSPCLRSKQGRASIRLSASKLCSALHRKCPT